MSLIVVKIPRSRRRVQILRSDDHVQKAKDERLKKLQELERTKSRDEELRKLGQLEIVEAEIEEIPQEEVQTEPEEIVEEPVVKVIPRTIFTEEFIISNSNQPVEISLKNIPDDSLPLLEAMEEIQKSYDRGFSDGIDSVKITMETEIRNHYDWVRQIDIIADELRHEFSKAINEFGETVISLSTMIAGHILENEVTTNTSAVLDQAKKVITGLDEENIYKIRVNPEDYIIFNESKSMLINDETKQQSVYIVPDSSVDRGGCILETSAGTIDARMKSQLEKIKESLIEASKIPDEDKFN